MAVQWMIFICVVFLLFLIGAGVFRKIGGFLLRGGMGALCIYISNFLIAPLIGVSVGVNLLTAFIVGILGIPGFLMLYIVSWIL